MPTVYLPSMMRSLAGGRDFLEVSGGTVGEVIEQAEAQAPGLRDRVLEGDRLRSNIAVAINGEIGTLGLLEKVEPDSEIHFVAAISGGGGVPLWKISLLWPTGCG